MGLIQFLLLMWGAANVVLASPTLNDRSSTVPNIVDSPNGPKLYPRYSHPTVVR